MQLRSGFRTGEQGGRGGTQPNNTITLSAYIITNMATDENDNFSTKAQAGTSSHGSDYEVDQEEGHDNNGIGLASGPPDASMLVCTPSAGNRALATSITDWATASATDNNNTFRGSGAQFASSSPQQPWADEPALWPAGAQIAPNMRKRRMHDENPDHSLQGYTRDPNSPDRMKEDLDMMDVDAAGEGQGSKSRKKRGPKRRKGRSNSKGKNGHHEPKDQDRNGKNGHAGDEDVVMG